MNELALCAGVGGISLGLKLAVRDLRTVCYVEREAFAAEHLAAKGESGALDRAPVWSDLATFDGRPWRSVVDLVSAGFPCQPFSDAGARLGTADPRWLWPEIERVVEECEPTFVFVENVPGVGRRGLAAIITGLARLGFDAEWDVFSAAGVGAPHIRRRFFLLARHPDREGEPARAVDDEVAGLPKVVVDAAGVRRAEGPQAIRSRQPVANVTGEAAAERDWWELEPGVGRVADGVADRVDRLRALGNGVVPLVVAHAFRTLADRM